MSSFAIAILSLLTGAACLYLPRSAWFNERLMRKYEDSEEIPEDDIEREKNTWAWMGIFWVVFGLIQMVLGL